MGCLMLIQSNFNYSRDFVILGALWCDLNQTKLFSINPNFLFALWCDLDQTKLFSINPNFLCALQCDLYQTKLFSINPNLLGALWCNLDQPKIFLINPKFLVLSSVIQINLKYFRSIQNFVYIYGYCYYYYFSIVYFGLLLLNNFLDTFGLLESLNYIL